MSINYRKEVDNGFDRKRIVEKMTIEALKSGIPIEIIKKEKYYNFNHNEMMQNLGKGFNSKLETLEEEYHLYGVDPLEIELSDDYFKVSHPIGGELYPMTSNEQMEKFKLRDSLNEQLEKLKEMNSKILEKEYENALDELILFKSMNPIIDQIIDCLDTIEIEDTKKEKLSLEEIAQIYTQIGLEPSKLQEYNKIYNAYKILEKNLDDITKNYNLSQEGKFSIESPEMKKIHKLKNEVEKEILLRNTKLVNGFIRKKFKNLLVEADDLFQVCYLGLFKAIQTYDINRETKFSTHAYVIMNTEVQRNFKELTGLNWQLYWEKKYLEKQLKIMSETLERQATLFDLYDYGLLSIPYDKASSLLNSNYILPGYKGKEIKQENQENYKDYEVTEEESEEYEDGVIDFPFDRITSIQLKEEIEKVLGTLTQREEEVLRLRFGLEDGKQYSLEEVGAIYEVTRERIRQIEAKALRKLRHPSRSSKVKDFIL